MAHTEAQMLIHRERLQKLTKIEYNDLLNINEQEWKELIKQLKFADQFEVDHILQRLIALNIQENGAEPLKLTRLWDSLHKDGSE